MPRFVADDSETDEEIVEIPYVKPAPVVIDLLESDSSREGSPRKGSPKKSKKKKAKRDREKKEKDGHSSKDVASSGDSAGKSGVSVSSPNGTNDKSTNQDGVIIVEIIGDQVGEPSTSSRVDNGLRDVVTEKNISVSIASSSTECQEGIIAVGDLNSTPNRQKKSTEIQSKEVSKTPETGGPPATPASSSNKEKTPKSKERRARGEGKSRTRKMSATQRTNEEIVNFLTTLGIEMDINAFNAPPVVTRRSRNSRKRLADAALDTNGISSEPASASTPDQSAKSFVSVTQEDTPVSSRATASKGKRQRKAINGDLSDFTITTKDLNEVNTSFQSNVVMPDGDNSLENIGDSFITVVPTDSSNRPGPSDKSRRESTYDEVINAVAKGLKAKVKKDKKPHPKENQNETAEVTENDQSKIKDISISKDMDLSKDGKDIPGTSGDGAAESIESLVPSNPEVIEVERPQSLAEKVVSDDTAALIPKQLSTIDANPPVPAVITNKSSSADTPTEKSSSSQTKDQTKTKIPDLVKPSETDIEGKCKAAKKSQDSQKHGHVDHREASSREKPIASTNEKENSGQARTSTEAKKSNMSSGSDNVSQSKNNSASQSQRGCPEINVASSQRSGMSTSAKSSESYYPATWTEHMKDFYGTPRHADFELDHVMPSLSDSSNLWEARKDRMPPPKNKRRVRCENCKQLGHFSRECTEKRKPPTCHYCGEVGHTSDSNSRHYRNCPQAKCLNCGNKLSQYAQKCNRCLQRSQPVRCGICKVTGHVDSLCPDNWRRYHSITTPDQATMDRQDHDQTRSGRTSKKDSNIYKRSASMHCSNCGRKGHNYYECSGNRLHKYPRNKPYIIHEIARSEPDVGRQQGQKSVPISYDSRTGRTVVMNSAANQRQPELEVETIQVKITNELAFLPESQVPKVSRAELIQCEDKECRNMLRSNEKCYEGMIASKAHRKLLQDECKGLLKPLEQKYHVRISVLDDGCKVHICGFNALEADIEMMNVLWHKTSNMNVNANYAYGTNNAKTVQQGSSGIFARKTNDTQVNRPSLPFPNAPSLPEKWEMPSAPSLRTPGSEIEIVDVCDEDDDDCCVIDEVPNKTASQQKHGSSRAAESVGKSEKTLLQHDPAERPKEMDPATKTHQKEEDVSKEHDSTSCGKFVLTDYVSPLAGLSLFGQDTSSNYSTGPIQTQPTVNDAVSVSTTTGAHRDARSLNANDMMESVPSTSAEIKESMKRPNIGDHAKKQLKKKTNNVQKSTSPQADRFEIITLEDEDDNDDESEPSHAPLGSPSTSQSNECKIGLIPTELNSCIVESSKQNSIFKQIAMDLGVKIIVSKEMSAIIVENGRKEARVLAKEEVVSWLESKSLNTEYYFVPGRMPRPETPSRNRRDKTTDRLESIQHRNIIRRKRQAKKRNIFPNNVALQNSISANTNHVAPQSYPQMPSSIPDNVVTFRRNNNASRRKHNNMTKGVRNSDGNPRFSISTGQMQNRFTPPRVRYFNNFRK